MRKYLLLFFSFNLLYTAYPQEIPGIFYKRMVGSIDDENGFIMNIMRVDSVLTGGYYSNTKGKLINFTRSSVDSAGNLYLVEDGGYDEKSNMITTGVFKGKFTRPDHIEGTWENSGSSSQLPFSADEKYTPGSAKFDINRISKEYTNFGNASIQLKYITMNGFPDSKVQHKINTYLDIELRQPTDITEDTSLYKNAESLVDDFIDAYIEDIVADSAELGEYVPQYFHERSTSVLFNSDYILSLELINSSYLGGAHPNTFLSLVSFNLHNGNIITLDDIFKPGSKEKLNRIGEKKFREYYELKPGESLEASGFWFEHGFNLNDNFLITTAGIRFLFNQYEVGPYALGAPEVYIPFSEIKDLLKENSIIN